MDKPVWDDIMKYDGRVSEPPYQTEEPAMTDAAQTETLAARLREIAGKYDEYDWHGDIEREAAGEIERLTESLQAMTLERDKVIGQRNRWDEACQSVKAELAKAERELEACRLDAERYKFLRAFMLMADDEAGAQITLLNSTNGEPETPAEVDAASTQPGRQGRRMNKPYKVVVDVPGCKHCQAGKMWSVLQPNGALLGQSWGCRSDAADVAELMNRAHADGCAITLQASKRGG